MTSTDKQQQPGAEVAVTAAEVNVALSALYAFLVETKSYIRSAERGAHAHDGHGDQCCGKAYAEHEAKGLEALKERKRAVRSVIDKFEAAEKEMDR